MEMRENKPLVDLDHEFYEAARVFASACQDGGMTAILPAAKALRLAARAVVREEDRLVAAGVLEAEDRDGE
jgi:RNA polymerase-interacting CarD/CdnL/TRCF family regulator